MIDQGRVEPTPTQENRMTLTATTHPDEAIHKGAAEDDAWLCDAKDGGQTRRFTAQLGHRDQDEMLKDNDTDFPEPDAKAEITGR
jgi:hypothetical protein